MSIGRFEKKWVHARSVKTGCKDNYFMRFLSYIDRELEKQLRFLLYQHSGQLDDALASLCVLNSDPAHKNTEIQ